jgi:hypothetical protein
MRRDGVLLVMGPRLRQISVAIPNYIALSPPPTSTTGRSRGAESQNYPLSYLPFALTLVVGVGLRVAVFVK